jgi:acyl dehydratase
MKYFDELVVGEELLTPGRTMTEADVVMFAGLTGDYNAIHTDAEAMKDSQFGGRLVHGLFALSMSHGLLFRTGLLDGSGIAFVGIDELKFLAPVRIGDTLHGRNVVKELKPSRSKPDRGVASFYFELINQDGIVVQSYIHKHMMKKKPEKD